MTRGVVYTDLNVKTDPGNCDDKDGGQESLDQVMGDSAFEAKVNL